MTEAKEVPPGGEPGGTATPRRRRSRVLITAGIAVGCVLALGGAAAGFAYWNLDNRIDSVDINTALGADRPTVESTPSASASATPEVATGVLNILVLGSDSRTGGDNAELGGGSDSGARSDTAMVVHVNADHTEATVVSIPRDTLVYRPACPTSDGGTTAASYSAMFNSAYSVGGPVCAVKTVEQLTGVRMDHYVEIDFTGFADLIDALGGVTVTTKQDIDDEKSRLHLKAGTHHLDGTEALAFARTRHGIGNGSDLGRIGLQQQLITAILKQVGSSDLFTSPADLYAVTEAATGSLTADTGLDSLSELLDLAYSLRLIGTDDLTTVTLPVVTAPFDPNRVVADEPAAGKVWKALMNDTEIPESVLDTEE